MIVTQSMSQTILIRKKKEKGIEDPQRKGKKIIKILMMRVRPYRI